VVPENYGRLVYKGLLHASLESGVGTDPFVGSIAKWIRWRAHPSTNTRRPNRRYDE
jgi:hypothetical protein